MASQIIYGRSVNKEISFAAFDQTINLTDYLSKTCRTFFVDETFLEDEEEISYPVVTTDKISNMLKILTEHEVELMKELQVARGNEKKKELLGYQKDLSLLKNNIINMLLQDCPNAEKLLVLI